MNRQIVDLMYSEPSCGVVGVLEFQVRDQWGVGVMAEVVGNLDLFSDYSVPMISLERQTVVSLFFRDEVELILNKFNSLHDNFG